MFSLSLIGICIASWPYYPHLSNKPFAILYHFHRLLVHWTICVYLNHGIRLYILSFNNTCMEIIPCRTHVFLSGIRGFKKASRNQKIILGMGFLQQVRLWRTSTDMWCVLIVGWRFEWLRICRAWKRTMFKRLSSNIWAWGKSAPKSCQDF